MRLIEPINQVESRRKELACRASSSVFPNDRSPHWREKYLAIFKILSKEIQNLILYLLFYEKNVSIQKIKEVGFSKYLIFFFFSL